MDQFLTYALLGLAVGSIYALTAQGLVLVYRGSGVVNFAEGGFAMLGAFLYYKGIRDHGWPTAVAWIVALGVPALLGVLTHLLVMARLRRASPLVRVVATLAVFFTIVAVATKLWGTQAPSVRSPLPHTGRYPFGRGVPPIGEDRLWLILLAIVVTAVLSAAFRWTRWGHSTEAVSENPVAASALGYSPDRIAAVNWGLGGALAALAGVLIAPILTLSVAALAFTVLRGLAAALIGSFRSFWLALVGAFGIGFVESVLDRYIKDGNPILGPITSRNNLLFGEFTSISVSRSAAFLIIVIVLLIGGRALPLRNELLDRLPVVGGGRPDGARLLCVAAAVAAAAVLLMTLPDQWALALTISLATSIVCLSLVVVTGYSGQVSLAQMGLAGFGAWVAGRLAVGHGWPFPVVLVLGAVATVPLGVLVAIPALRTRGVNLAVLTFGLSVVISELILTNSGLTGGFFQTRPHPPTLFGWKIDAFTYPGRYGLVVLVVLTLASLAVGNLRRGRSGLRLLAVRANERSAASLGVNVAATKVYAFAVGAAIAALGGTLLAFRHSTIVYTDFGGFASIQVVVISVIGGIGYVLGPLFAGTLVLGGIGGQVVRSLGLEQSTLDLVSGVLLLVILFANPNGVANVNVELANRAVGKLRRRPAPAAPPIDLRRGDELRLAASTLAVEDLTVRFGGVVAVDRLSLAVRPGEVVGLIGPNGAGKTTVIDAMTGFVRAAPGSVVTLDGAPVGPWSPMRRARAGLVRSWQSLELFEDVTVRENLLVACDDRSSGPLVTDLVTGRRPELTPAAVAAVREFDLVDDLDRYPDELSHGRRRLVAIARTIAASPRVLLLDEPASGLSGAEAAELGRLIGRLAHSAGLAVLLIEHDVDLVLSVCDRVAVMNFGKLIALGPPAAIVADAEVKAAYLGDADQATAAAADAGTGSGAGEVVS